MIKKRIAVLSLSTVISVWVSSVNYAPRAQVEKQEIKVKGTVVAYDLSAARLAMLTSVPSEEILIVRVGKLSGGRQESQYIKVVYRRWYNEIELPKEVYDGKKQWLFTLKRESHCDGSLKELLEMKSKNEVEGEVSLPRLQRTPGSEADEMPNNVILPCYVLRPGTLKPYGPKK